MTTTRKTDRRAFLKGLGITATAAAVLANADLGGAIEKKEAQKALGEAKAEAQVEGPKSATDAFWPVKEPLKGQIWCDPKTLDRLHLVEVDKDRNFVVGRPIGLPAGLKGIQLRRARGAMNWKNMTIPELEADYVCIGVLIDRM